MTLRSPSSRALQHGDRDDGRDRGADLHRHRDRRAVDRARCTSGPPGSARPAPATSSCTAPTSRRPAAPSRVTLQPGLRLHAEHHDRSGQGNGDRARRRRRWRCPTPTTTTATRSAARPRYLADMQGAFEVTTCGAGRAGRCVRQMSPRAPITWDTLSDPYALLGDIGWSQLPGLLRRPARAGRLRRGDRAGRPGSTRSARPGSTRTTCGVSNTGAWSLFRNDVNNPMTPSAQRHRRRRSAPTPGTTWR